MQLPLTLQLKPSPTFLAVLTSGHILAGVAVLFLPLPWPAIGVLLLLLAVSCWSYWRHHLGRLPRLMLGEEGRLSWQRDLESETEALVLSPATIVLPWLVILHIRGVAPLLIFPDALTVPDSFRQLRVWLLWWAEAGPKPD